MTTEEKFESLKSILKDMGQVIVAYSGGVDSAFLLKVAVDTLGNNAFGVLAISPTYPSREYKKTIETAKIIGARLEIIETHETDNPNFIENPVNRCYFCKTELFEKIGEIAQSGKYRNMVDGSNADALGDHRPGMKALKEKGIRSPLQEAGLTKKEIRELSHTLGLPTWDKDALACLSSRFPYGEKISPEKLSMVDRVENYLFDLGFRNIRARHLNNTVKIEVAPHQISRFFEDEMRTKILKTIKKIGYTYVTVDLEGYRQGSLNETLPENKRISGKELTPLKTVK